MCFVNTHVKYKFNEKNVNYLLKKELQIRYTEI